MGDARYYAKAARALLIDPYEGKERILERLSERRWGTNAWELYQPAEDWHRSLHDLLGLRWPCAAGDEFGPLWAELDAELWARGLPLGRGTFGSWDDAGSALALAVYCLVRSRQPERVVETGVGRGVTTRFVLQALARNDHGALWSIDLPTAVDTTLHASIAIAVPEGLRGRWTLCEGSSRRRLPKLLARLGAIDLFVHDSMHTVRNISFELERVWPRLTPGGAIVTDDINLNHAFRRFAEGKAGPRWLVAEHDDHGRLFGIAVKSEIAQEAAASRR